MKTFDVHAHFGTEPTPETVKNLRAALRREGFVHDGPPTQWSPQAALDFMDERDIALQLLSLPIELSAEQVRASNQAAAQIVANTPDRFGMLASLPMTDPARAVDEIRHASDTLGTDGFALLSNYGGAYFGDDRFEPVFAELDRLHASIFVHPVIPTPFHQLGLGRPGPLIEYPMDTARTIVDAVFAGLFLRYPNLRMVVAHAGGVLPALSQRIVSLGAKDWVNNPRELTREQLTEQLASLYLDTAIAGTPVSLLPAMEMAGADHLVFGTDYPPAGIDVVDQTITDLHSTLSSEDRQRMETTFSELFPAAAARAGA